MKEIPEDSILNTVKHHLGIDTFYTAFDDIITMDINSVISILYQLGVGESGFCITGQDERWSDYVGSNMNVEFIKTYVCLKVKLMFDPPSGAVMEATKNTIDELEWRISISV